MINDPNEEMEAEQTEPAAETPSVDLARLDAFGDHLSKTRKQAIEGRFNSGIEHEWLAAEDAYEGVDDANRAQEHQAGRYRFRKPSTINGAVESAKPDDPSRSTILLNITRPYVDATAARVGDMLLPSDEQPWALTPTPIPEIADLAAMGSNKPIPESANAVAQATGRSIEDIKAEAERVQAVGKKAAEDAQKRIEDWLIECKWHGHVRRALDDVTRLGTGIIKGPFPEKRRQIRVTEGQIDIQEEIKPASRRVDPWNFYPDPMCGENIHNGGFTWERDDITGKTLRDLKGTPGFIDEQIDLCLSEGPQKAIVDETVRPERFTDATPYEIWYYHGVVEREDLEAAGCDCSGMGQETIAIPAVVTMVNARVIRATLNPLDKGCFPYDLMVWQERRGSPWGIGVPMQLREPQRIIKAATRAMMDNAGISSGPQIVMMRGAIIPADGNWAISPRKLWFADPTKDVREVQHAFHAFSIDTRQEELMAIVQFGMKMAEDVTGFPLLMQGQQGEAPEILGVVQILNNNASSVLRRIARNFDHRFIEPHIERYYDWLMQYGEDDEEKVIFIVDARGSSVLVERDLQNQAIVNMAQIALNPSFGVDPRKYAAEAFKAQRLDPKRFQYSDEEWQRIQEAQQQQPQDPRIAVAEMSAKLKQLELQVNTENADRDRQVELFIANLKREIAVIEATGREGVDLAKIKAMLAQTAITERNKVRMFEQEATLRRTTGEGI